MPATGGNWVTRRFGVLFAGRVAYLSDSGDRGLGLCLYFNTTEALSEVFVNYVSVREIDETTFVPFGRNYVTNADFSQGRSFWNLLIDASNWTSPVRLEMAPEVPSYVTTYN